MSESEFKFTESDPSQMKTKFFSFLKAILRPPFLFLLFLIFSIFMLALTPHWIRIIVPLLLGLFLVLDRSKIKNSSLKNISYVIGSFFLLLVAIWLFTIRLADLMFRHLSVSAVFLIAFLTAQFFIALRFKNYSKFKAITASLIKTALLAILLLAMSWAMVQNFITLKWSFFFWAVFVSALFVKNISAKLEKNSELKKKRIFIELMTSPNPWLRFVPLGAAFFGVLVVPAWSFFCGKVAEESIHSQPEVIKIAETKDCSANKDTEWCRSALVRSYDFLLLPDSNELASTVLTSDINMAFWNISDPRNSHFSYVGPTKPDGKQFYTRRLFLDEQDGLLYHPTIGPEGGKSSLDIVTFPDFKPVRSIPADNKLYQIALDKKRNRVFLLHEGDELEIRDLTTGEKIAGCCLNKNNKYGIYFDDLTNKIYFTQSLLFHPINILDASTLKQIGSIYVGKSPWNFAVDPERRLMFVNEFFGSKIVAINMNSDKVIWKKRVGIGAREVALDKKSHTLFILCMGDASVWVIDYLTKRKLGEFYVGSSARSLHYNSKTERLFAGSCCGIYEIRWKKLLGRQSQN